MCASSIVLSWVAMSESSKRSWSAIINTRKHSSLPLRWCKDSSGFFSNSNEQSFLVDIQTFIDSFYSFVKFPNSSQQATFSTIKCQFNISETFIWLSASSLTVKSQKDYCICIPLCKLLVPLLINRSGIPVKTETTVSFIYK